jgi:RepB DNA-primase from phage plasmid
MSVQPGLDNHNIPQANDTPGPALKLWRHVLGGTRGLLAIWTGQRDANGKIPEETAKTRFFNYPGEGKDAAEWALEESARGREAYFCTHLLTKRRRIKENAQEVHTLWGELDGAEVPDGELAPSAVIESSPGRFHCYWRLADPIPPQDAELLNKRLARKIGADPSGFDRTQLLRVPNTVNYKYKAHPVVTVRRLEGTRTYSAGDLDRILPQAVLAEREATKVHKSASRIGAEREDAEVLRLLNNAANGAEWREVYDGGGEFPSPSERDQSLANRIAFYTQDVQQVERIMRTSGCVRPKWDDHRTYLQKTIGKAIHDLTNTYQPAAVAEIGTAPRKRKLDAGVRDLRRRWRDHDWARVVGTADKSNWMRGHTCRDVLKVLIDQAEEHGTVAGAGDDGTIEVSIGRRKLALLAATSLRTVHKTIRHLEADGWLEFRPPESEEKPGTYVMCATLHHVLTSTRGEESVVNVEGGGEELRTPGVVPRLRWSAPYVRRLGKHNGAIIDRLVGEGEMHVEELAEATNKRPSDLLRRNLSKLEEAGIVFLDGAIVRLADDWQKALQKKRQADGEIEAEERDRKKYREQSEKYRNRDRTPADEEPPLMGPQRVEEIVRERAKEDLKARIEEQRRKVGMTADVFLADEMADVVGVRLVDVMDRWQRRGGEKADLWRAARHGPYRFKREADGEQYVEHADGRDEDAYDRKVAECMHNLGAKQDRGSAKGRKAPTEVPLVGGVYQHGQECECDWCAA